MSYNFQLFFIHKIQCNTKTIKICLQRFSVFCLKIFEHFPHFFFTPYKYFFFHFTQENKHILLIIFVNLEKTLDRVKKPLKAFIHKIAFQNNFTRYILHNLSFQRCLLSFSFTTLNYSLGTLTLIYLLGIY